MTRGELRNEIQHGQIGDEMGLGKTVQAIAAAEILGRHFAAGPWPPQPRR